jgi:hypothetical protein
VEAKRIKVLILVKHGLYHPWVEIAKQGQNETWLSAPLPEDVEVIHYYGKPTGKYLRYLDHLNERLRWKSKTSKLLIRAINLVITFPFLLYIPSVKYSAELNMKHREIQINIPDTILNLRWKQLAGYRFLLRTIQFDFLYETNTSSYVNIPNLLKTLREIQTKPLYAGSVIVGEFVSGANRLMDRQSLTRVVKSRLFWDPTLLEDRAIGKLMRILRIKMTNLPTTHIISESEVANLTSNQLDELFHFRVKSGNQSARNDVQIMKSLEKHISNNNIM